MLHVSALSGPYPFGTFIGKQLRMEGFIVYRWVKEMPAAITEMAKWMQEVSSHIF